MKRLLVPIVILLSPPALSAQTISGWRGNGTGRFSEAKPVLAWSPTEKIVWKTPLPGGSPATPVFVRDRIFVLSDPSLLLCLRASDGEILWQRSHAPADLGGAGAGAANANVDHNPDGNAGSAASTPVSDGKYVFAMFANGVVSCHDLDGGRKWARFVEKPKTGFGPASSPLLIGNSLFGHFIDFIALDAQSGKELWRRERRPPTPPRWRPGSERRTWSSIPPDRFCGPAMERSSRKGSTT
jgi:outer membrane protein assembly factor BamB